MIEQRVENRSMRGWRGVALVLGVAALVILGSNLFSWLERYIGHASSVLFIFFGCVVAWFLLNWYVMDFKYVCAGGCLRVFRVYGRRERFMLDLWLSGVQACGALDDMRRRWPNARVQRAVKPECPIEPLAVVYNDAGKTAILFLQPNDALRRVIVEAARD